MKNKRDNTLSSIQLLYNRREEYKKETLNCSKIALDILRTYSNLKDNDILTGYDDFDNQFRGFNFGELVIVGGRPAMGKTAFLINLAFNISTSYPILYFSQDMSTAPLIMRMLLMLSGVEEMSIFNENIEIDQHLKILPAFEELQKYNIHINSNYKITLDEFKGEIKRYVEEFGVKIIFLDYLQLADSMIKDEKSDIEKQKLFSKIIRDIADELNVLFIVTSQLKKTTERDNGNRPIIKSIDYADIVELSDKVILLYRPGYYGYGDIDHDIMDLIIAKNEQGLLGSAKVRFDRITSRISSI